MSDIFISYARKDRPIAINLANALESENWTVWWDRRLRGGDYFDDVIQTELDKARCVIVLWSESSVQSQYVKAEAARAQDHNKLIPVSIGNVTLPLRFALIHTLSLLGWDGSEDSSEFRRLVQDIAVILGPKGTVRRKGQSTNRKQSATQGQPEEHQSKAMQLANQKLLALANRKRPIPRSLGFHFLLSRVLELMTRSSVSRLKIRLPNRCMNLSYGLTLYSFGLLSRGCLLAVPILVAVFY